ncbi:MAG: AAA family ATPase [Rhodoplanes sp.]
MSKEWQQWEPDHAVWDRAEREAEARRRRLNGQWQSRNGEIIRPTVEQHVSTLREWLDRDLPKPDPILGSWLTTTSRSLLVAPTGIGKTMFAIAIGRSVSDGAAFLHWRGVRPAKVLFVDGEMPRRLLQARLAAEVQRGGACPDGMHILSREDFEIFPPLNTPEGQSLIDNAVERIGGVDLVEFDNVMSLIAGDMKDEQAWKEQTMPWVLSLTRRNIGQLWIHHTGHDETRSYGTKTREWQMDTVIHLESVEHPETDVSFHLTFTKARERMPETRADFVDTHVTLIDDEWRGTAFEQGRKSKVSPLAEKFLAALRAANGGNLKAVPMERWREQCIKRGLLDVADRPKSASALFSKYRRELIAANLVVCNETEAWATQ